MNEFLDTAAESDVLEVIEGLLDLCMQREAQIAELIMERERAWIKKNYQTQDGDEELLLEEAGYHPRSMEPDREGVLVVDDTEMMRIQLVQFFRSNGYKVVGAAVNGREAVQLYEKYRPALVTMDTDMPVMNGYEATRRIKQIDPGARVVIISHVLERKMILEAIKCGATDYLVKPVRPSRLLQLIEHLPV